MRIEIDQRRVRLIEPDDFTRFDIVARTDQATARARLHAAGAGSFTPGGEVAVPFGFVRFAAGAVAESDEWRAGFDRMVAFARTKGWITPDFEILGHVEWHSTSAPVYRVGVVGLGVQGSGIVRGLQTVGHEVVAGVDIGDRVGRPLSEVVTGFTGTGEVLGSVDDLIRTFPGLDVVVLAAAVRLDTTLDWAARLVEAGVNVVSLDPEAFSYGSWVPDLDARAKKGGGSFMGVGVQDVAWVQLMAVAGGAVAGATSITLVNRVPIEVLSEGLITAIGAGLTEEEFAAGAGAEEYPESTLISGPLREAARHLGATPGPISTAFGTVVGDTDYEWITGGRTLRAGTIQGLRETASFDTDLGIRFDGVIEIVPGGEEVSENVIEFAGDPDLRVTFGPISTSVTDSALISRIADVIAAPPGALFSADLPPARHQTPASRQH